MTNVKRGEQVLLFLLVGKINLARAQLCVYTKLGSSPVNIVFQGQVIQTLIKLTLD